MHIILTIVQTKSAVYDPYVSALRYHLTVSYIILII